MKTIKKSRRRYYVAWNIEITSFRMVSFGAEHWYGHIMRPDYKRLDVEFKLSAQEAEQLNKKDNYATYKKGDPSTRFKTRDAVVAAGKKLFKKLAPANAVLLVGNRAVDPLQAIAGPEVALRELAKIWEAAESSGRWEGDHKAMQRAADVWDAWWEKHTKRK